MKTPSWAHIRAISSQGPKASFALRFPLVANVFVQYEPQPDDKTIDAAVGLYVQLMRDSAPFLAATSGRPELGPLMARGVIMPFSLIAGEMYTARDENGTLVGFTVWIPPGRDGFDSPDQFEMGFGDFLSQLDEEGRAFQEEAIGKTMPQFIDQSLRMEKAELNAYWCWFAMVREEYQGQGLCRQMFDLVHEKAKAAGATMALLTENPRNIAIYEKLGFNLKGEQKTVSPWCTWTWYLMSRNTSKEE